MSDDEADPELLELLRQSLRLGKNIPELPPSTGVLKSAEFIADNAIDVSLSLSGTKDAAEKTWRLMQEKEYSTRTWSEHELHPKTKDEETLNFIFTMNLLNFSFWSELGSEERFQVEYRGRRWTGYWSLVAALQRALDEGHPITTPFFWTDTTTCPDSLMQHIFRSATAETMPLLSERISILREAGEILVSQFSSKPSTLITQANHSAALLVNLLTASFPSFADTSVFHGQTVKLYKRAQIFAADVWACFNGESFGHFTDIDTALTMFADYRIPQMLQGLGVLWYSPRLASRIRRGEMLESGEEVEVEIRGCSIWAVEMLRRTIEKNHPDARGKLNAVLIDFFLYDTVKEMERDKEREKENENLLQNGNGRVKETQTWRPEQQHDQTEMLPHHRTRSIWY